MLRLSSNLTLFLKLFIPVFWTTILVGLTAVIWFGSENSFGGVPIQTLRYAMLFVLLTGVAAMYLVLWPLRRVETDGEFVYVSNYFKTARYHLTQEVEAIHESRLLFLTLCTLELRGKGVFGRRIRFVASRSQFRMFREQFGSLVRKG